MTQTEEEIHSLSLNLARFVEEKHIIELRNTKKGTAFDIMMVECKSCGALPYAVSTYEYNKIEDKCANIAERWNRRTVNSE